MNTGAIGCGLLYLYSKECPMLAIRLPAEIEHRLEALAQATGRTKTFYAREAILEYMDDLEDVYLAESRLEALRGGRSHSMSLEDVERDLGLAN